MMSSDDLQNISGALHILKRRVNAENSSLRTHLKSIIHDSQLVDELKEFLPQYPLFANLYVQLHDEINSPRTSAALIKQNYLLTCYTDNVRYFRRNGKWYSDTFAGHCYFKSTDGHESSWSFSLSRTNLDFARAAAACGGAIIVDSTRQGKKFPDSLSATVRLLWMATLQHPYSIDIQGHEW